MRSAGFAHHTMPSTRLLQAAEKAPPHLAPILAATAAGAIAFGSAQQHGGPFRFPRGRPVVLIVADDMDLSYGPGAFHAKSLKRFLRSAGSVVIVSGAPDPRAYAAALAGPLATGKSVAIIESREAHEPAWIALVREAHPGIATLISTPGRGGEALN